MSEKKIEKLYYNPTQPGSYSGFSSFEIYIDIPKGIVKNWLLDQDTYNLHRPIRKKFKRNRIIVSGIDDTWQADLIDLQNFSKENNGFKYLLTVIDVFSKYAWVFPIQNKTNKAIISSFQKIFQKRRPKKIHTDQGQEFVGKECQKFFKDHGISFYTLNSNESFHC